MIDQTYLEFADRDASYLPRFGVTIGDPRGGAWPSEMQAAVAAGLQYLQARHGFEVAEDRPADDVSWALACGIADVYLAAEGAYAWPDPGRRPVSNPSELEGYTESRTRNGRRFFVRNAQGPSVLLVGALGIPLSVWGRFLCDPTHDLRLIVPEMRCADAFEGGMRSDAGLEAHAADLLEVLEAAGGEAPHVLAWCNAGRIAVHLARLAPERIAGVILLTVTFRGAAERNIAGSAFEENLDRVFTAVTARPHLAPGLVKVLNRPVPKTDWDPLAHDPDRRAGVFLSLPAEEFAQALLAPMSNAPYLVNYARRTKRDEAHPLREDVRELGTRVLVVTGSHDRVVSNEQTRAVLRASRSEIRHATVFGGGHYVQDLQYPYLRWLVDAFVAGSATGAAPLRVQLEPLAQTAC